MQHQPTGEKKRSRAADASSFSEPVKSEHVVVMKMDTKNA